ncbi:MAG TPA: nitrogenase molybdenum-iron protein subunit beta [Epsilonproteobacteria bacterium]|nr:nitrogenase molybdenum-iron protein subunit beta [Campylobacterota bacterium]
MQDVNKIDNGQKLFQHPEYQDVLKNKKQFEGAMGAVDTAKVEEVAEWTRTWDYREKNLAREAITVNPAKACQPLGAVMVALGFEDTMPYVHGSHGCVAYFRSYFTRHFKEPTPCVSDSMTEDAAVFGGLVNMKDGLKNCAALYKPKMIAVSTTCMAEVIGDDLYAFAVAAKEEDGGEFLPEDYPIPYAHTPSFTGSHITGYDNMMHGIMSQLTEGVEVNKNEKINIIPGFETYIGSIRSVKNIVESFGAEYTMLGDHSDQWDMPAGEYSMFQGGTKIEDAKDCKNSKATLSLQKYATVKTMKMVTKRWKQKESANLNPIGLKGTDEFIMKLAELTGKEVPENLKTERGRLVDAMQDSYPYMHGKKFAIWGDPDFLVGMVSFLLEMGAEPTHVLCHNAPRGWEEEMRALLDTSPAAADCHVWAGKDLWHMRSLLFTEPVDFMIGNSYGKELMRDTGTPLIYIGFPIFDRHHLHRYSIAGYDGALNLLTWITNKVLDQLDEDTKGIASTDYFFDLIR